jgi:hypothetical protein
LFDTNSFLKGLVEKNHTEHFVKIVKNPTSLKT